MQIFVDVLGWSNLNRYGEINSIDVVFHDYIVHINHSLPSRIDVIPDVATE